MGIARITLHEGYVGVANDYKNDIAVIRLSSEATLTASVQPACLPTADNGWPLPGGLLHSRTGIVTGFGIERFEDPRDFNTGVTSEVLQVLLAPVKSDEACRVEWERLNFRFDPAVQMCAGGEVGKDACRGDSGGPLLVRGDNSGGFILAGVVSFGSRLCGDGTTGIYTKVEPFTQWIIDKIN